MLMSTVRLLRAIANEEQTDAELLARFTDRRDEAAFALLVRRHAAMVYGVCRRILPTDQDAEDAFQSTFLVLVEKARAVPREAVGNWLYGVARRAALLSRRTITTRRERAAEMDAHPAPEPLNELRAALDEELSRLPDMYRAVIILCDLEERTRREVAATLGWPEGTVAGRLARARKMLAKRLARHAPSVSVAAVLSGAAAARVPEVLAFATVHPAVAALTREVTGAMMKEKLMKAATVVVLLACAGFGVALHAGQKPGANKPAAAPVGPAAPANPTEADGVVWGQEVGGLQAGLSAKAATCRHGETIRFTVTLRNAGKADAKISYGLLREYTPDITSGSEQVAVAMPPIIGYKVRLSERVIKPGETVELYNPQLAVEGPLPDIEPPAVSTPTIRVRPGKYAVRYARFLQSHPKLATGEVQVEVLDPEPRLHEPEPDVQEVVDPRPVVMSPLQKDGARKIKARKAVVGRPVRVEGIAWGQPFGLKGQEGTVSPHAGPHVVYEGGSVFVRDVDFTETKARGKAVRVTGTLRFEPKSGTRWGDVKGYYYIEATGFEVLDAVTDPHLVYLEK